MKIHNCRRTVLCGAGTLSVNNRTFRAQYPGLCWRDGAISTFQVPAQTGMNVQQLLTGLEQIGPDTHLPVVWPTCSSVHLVNASTGKL